MLFDSIVYKLQQLLKQNAYRISNFFFQINKIISK